MQYFASLGHPFWHDLVAGAGVFGTLGTLLGDQSESKSMKRVKGSELVLFWDPFSDTFSVKSGSSDHPEAILEKGLPHWFQPVPVCIPQGPENSAPAAARARLAFFSSSPKGPKIGLQMEPF